MKKYIQFDEDMERRAKEEEAARVRQQELARQRYLEAVKKAEHCTLYHCSVADLKNFSGLGNGLSRDIIARRVGLGSGKTYEKGKDVVEAIDKELAGGDILQRGALLRMTLNEQSISAANNLLERIRQADRQAEEEGASERGA